MPDLYIKHKGRYLPLPNGTVVARIRLLQDWTYEFVLSGDMTSADRVSEAIERGIMDLQEVEKRLKGSFARKTKLLARRRTAHRNALAALRWAKRLQEGLK